MSRFANHSPMCKLPKAVPQSLANVAGKLSKTVPLTNPNFTKLAGAWLNTPGGKVEDFAHGSNLRSMVGVRMGKVFDLDRMCRFHTPANFVKLGLVKGTVFDSAYTADGTLVRKI